MLQLESHPASMLHDCTRTARFAPTILIAILCVVLLGGIAYSIRLGPGVRFLPDEQDYLVLARNLVSGNGYTLDGKIPTAFRAPGAAFLYGLVANTAQPVVLARVLNFMCLLATAAISFGLVRRMAGTIAGLVAAGISAFYPLAFFTAGTLYPQTLGGLFLISAIALWFTGKSRSTVALAGACAGLATLTVPTLLPSIAIAVVSDAIIARERTRLLWIDVALALLCTMLVVLPWTVRNRVELGEWVTVATNGGFNLLLGNSENTTPNAGVNVDINRYVIQVQTLGEVAQDRAYTRFAIAWVTQHPAQAIQLYIQKWLNHFNYTNALATSSEASGLRDLVSAITYYPLLVLAVVGVGLSRRLGYSRVEIVLWLVYLSGAFLSAIFFTRLRFRLPYDYVIIVLAIVTLSRILPALLAWKNK